MVEKRRAFSDKPIGWSPRVHNPLAVKILSWTANITSGLTRDWRPTFLPGREERFQALLRRELASSPLMNEADRVGGVVIDVDIRSAFGKPTLVNVDLRLTERQYELIIEHLRKEHEGEEGSQEIEDAQWEDTQWEDTQWKAYRFFLADLLERLVQAVWDNPEIAPVAVRGRGVLTDNSPEMKVKAVTIDMTDIGYQDETARPADLYRNLGAPASDPQWRP